MKAFFHLLDRLAATSERWLNIGATGLIMFLMLSVVADVFYRNLLTRSIPGLYELNELTLVGIVFFAVAYTQSVKGNVRMELVIGQLKGKPRLAAEFLALLLSLAICIVLLSRSVVDARTTIVMGLFTEGTIAWPFWPSRVAVSIGFFFVCVRLAFQCIQYLRSITGNVEQPTS